MLLYCTVLYTSVLVCTCTAQSMHCIAFACITITSYLPTLLEPLLFLFFFGEDSGTKS